jgi:galactokinase/mevalonate kinase-like predicted kinase
LEKGAPTTQLYPKRKLFFFTFMGWKFESKLSMNDIWSLYGIIIDHFYLKKKTQNQINNGEREQLLNAQENGAHNFKVLAFYHFC